MNISSDPSYETYHPAPTEHIPNNSDLPTVIYRDIFASTPDKPPASLERQFTTNSWNGCWRNGIFSFHHYHSTAHESLAVARGEAEVVIGGSGGNSFDVVTGDVLILPAGVGHCRKFSSKNFLVVGSYPNQQNWDLRQKKDGFGESIRKQIQSVPLPAMDPIYGEQGPLFELWDL